MVRAAKDAARWFSELPRAERPLFVSINVSSRQLFRPETIQEIRHVLGRNIVPSGTLRLEIAESLVMENPEQAADVLKVLRGSGVELALDDFGTGYSSLAYLNRFPFDTIKINRELVRSSGSASGAAIMRSMVALAHELSKTVVAEGVERADEATFLRSIGCEYAQGYHFGEPIPTRRHAASEGGAPFGTQNAAAWLLPSEAENGCAGRGGKALATAAANGEQPKQPCRRAPSCQRQKAISDKGRVNGAANSWLRFCRGKKPCGYTARRSHNRQPASAPTADARAAAAACSATAKIRDNGQAAIPAASGRKHSQFREAIAA